MRIIFMGTPDFSVGTLEALVEAGHEVCLVGSQPDKPTSERDAANPGERSCDKTWNSGLSAKEDP